MDVEFEEKWSFEEDEAFGSNSLATVLSNGDKPLTEFNRLRFFLWINYSSPNIS